MTVCKKMPTGVVTWWHFSVGSVNDTPSKKITLLCFIQSLSLSL
jgi:hypothetical protein